MMHHQMRFIFICSLLCATIAAASNDIIDTPKESQRQSTSVELNTDDVSSRSRSEVPGVPFETSHKAPFHNEFQTSHKISQDALKQQQGDLHQSMRSKEKPELDDQLAELIAADIKSNIEAKRLSEYEKYVIEPLTTEKPVTTTEGGLAQSINDGLIDDFSILEEAGSENKQQSRIQIKKGPNGQDYEYEYVYYYYDDDEAKNPEDSDVIIANKKSPATTTTTSTQPPAVSAGKASYASIERGSSASSGERNEIQSRGKGRAQALPPAPVVEEISDDRLPPATRFPQRGKSANSPQPTSSENVAPETGKKHHPKRPSVELVDSHLFATDDKDKSSQKGPRIIETEISKTELLETVSKSSVEYASSTVVAPKNDIDDEEEDTTPSMEKATFDLYAHIANENANEDEKKTNSLAESEVTTVEADEATTLCDDCSSPTTTVAPTTTTVVTTEPTTTTTTTPTTTTTTTTEAPTELPRGRGGITAGRNSNRFNFKGRSPTTTTAATVEATEAPKGKNRFQKPSFSSGGRTTRPTKTTQAPVTETVEKTEAQPATSNKFRSGARNRFNFRNSKDSVTTEKTTVTTGEAVESSTTTTRLARPSRPSFSIRGRGGRPSATPVTETPTQSTNPETTDENTEQDEKISSSSASPLATRPTSRLNIRPGSNRITSPVQKTRPSPVISRSRPNTNDDGNDDNKSAGEKESDVESTTHNNLNKIKNRPRIQIAESKVKKTTAQPVVNRKANPLISKRKFGVSSTTEAAVDEDEEIESDNAAKEGAKEVSESVNELKEEETTQAVEVTSEPSRGLGLLNRRKVNIRRPGTIN